MERIMKYISRVYRASVLDKAAAFGAYNITGPQLSYIFHVCRCPGLSQDELARRIFVHKSSVARHVASLVKAGFVRREKDPQDKRLRRLYPTEKAEALYPDLLRYLDEWNETLTEGLSDAEKDQLVYLMRHLARQAREHLGGHDLGELLGFGEDPPHA